MSIIRWAKDTSGNFAAGADWIGGKAPGSGDDAFMAPSGTTTITVTSSIYQSLSAFQTGATVTLSLTANEFVASGGTGAGANAGVVLVGNGATFASGGVFDNTGAVDLAGSTKSTQWILQTASTFKDAGVVRLGDSALNSIRSSFRITNIGNTFEGGGSIYGPLTNGGVVEATGVHPLILDLPGNSTNTATGVMEATGSGGMTIRYANLFNGHDVEAWGAGALVLQSMQITQTSAGIVLVGSGARAELEGANVIGGLVRVASGGVMEVKSGGDGIDAAHFTIAGEVVVDPNQSLFLGASVTNNGTVSISTGGQLFAGGYHFESGVTMGGTGVIMLADSPLTQVEGYLHNSTLTLDQPFMGAGVIKNLKLRNNSTVDATGVNALQILNPLGSNYVYNYDLFEAEGGGGLILQGNFTNPGHIQDDNGSRIQAQGGIVNSGAIDIAGASKGTRFIVGATGLDLTGKGQVSLQGPFSILIGSIPGASFTNTDNTIAGQGSVANLNISNGVAGLFEATVGSLVFGHDTVVNAGNLTANGGKLDFFNSSLIGGVMTAANGAVIAQGADIAGASIGTSGSGRFLIEGTGNTLDGVSAPVSIFGVVQAIKGAGITLEGAIKNTGRLVLTDQYSTVVAKGDLTGNGYVVLQDSQIVGSNNAAFTISYGELLAGGGSIGGAMTLTLEHGATVLANTSTPLTIDTGSAALVNDGELSASRGGLLVVKSAIDGTGTAFIQGGTLEADGPFSQKVTFGSGGGELILGHALDFTTSISGFSTTKGATVLDLRDIAFVSGTTKATYSGNATQGTLTVTDGTHTAAFTLIGDFTHSTFTVADDGHGGTKVTDPAGSKARAFAAAAAASLRAPASAVATHRLERPPPLTAAPHMRLV